MAGDHVNHRQRMRERVRRGGLDQLAPHEVLEYLLYHAIPQGDVNPLAHRLLRRFGTIGAVLSAPEEELVQVEGVGAHTARMLRAAGELVSAYREESRRERRPIENLREALGRQALESELPARPTLEVHCFDQDGYLLGSARYDWTEPFMRTRQLVAGVLELRAHSVVLALLCRREGYAMSEETWAEMRRVVRALVLLEVRVIDVMTRTPQGEVSSRQAGQLSEAMTALTNYSAAEEDEWMGDWSNDFSGAMEDAEDENDPG